MSTDGKDYLYCMALIGLVLAIAALLVGTVAGGIVTWLEPYGVIAIFFLFVWLYGLVTALVLALLAIWYPLRPGDYDTRSSQFTLWKVQHVVAELGKAALSLFFPVFARAAFYAIFGARVGCQVAVAGKILDPRLTELKDGCVLGEGCIVTSHAMANGRFVLREVTVGEGATVGVGCVLMPGVVIGARAVILPGAVLRTGTQVPAGETWGGVPAVPVKAAGA